MQIFRNLKPYWKSVIIIALLLVLQAYCDLSLPDYTSKLIDTGIQNYGIENCSPKQIPEKAYNVIDGFMDDDEKAVWEKYYKDGSDGYYYLTEDGEEHIEEVDSACMKGLMMYYYPYQMVNSDEDNAIKAGLDKMGITLDEMPEEIEQLIEIFPDLESVRLDINEYLERPKEVLNMFSEALRILDRNTAELMVDRMKDEIDELKVQAEENRAQLEEKDSQLEENRARLEEKDAEIDRLKKLLEEQNK